MADTLTKEQVILRLQTGIWMPARAAVAKEYYWKPGYQVEVRFLFGLWRRPASAEEIGEKPNMRYRVRKTPRG